ncbi:hypothetical protein Patl1_35094 [Pistacia atlantica]|uniref:Uncharacterized protein n=1 Tax=Pistacia atlantica TaxID=434234 RepID=A0ACC0ZNF3_9ROSI|nr:hypothetical protein Patl1_35094 [Pistacia atlantica]
MHPLMLQSQLQIGLHDHEFGALEMSHVLFFGLFCIFIIVVTEISERIKEVGDIVDSILLFV